MDEKHKNRIEWRFEKKFVLEECYFPSIIRSAFLEGYFQIYKDRRINSIYYDDVNLTAYYENLSGIAERTKYRLRFYGDREILEPRFERKIKKGDVNTKNISKFSGSIDSLLDFENIKFPGIRSHFPVCKVSYNRKYLFNHILGVRMTIDTDLIYSSLSCNQEIHDNINVVELKADKQIEISNLFEGLSFQTRNSKYCSAVSRLGLVHEPY